MYIYIAACLLLPETYIKGLCCCLSSVYISRIKYFEMYPQLVCLGNPPPDCYPPPLPAGQKSDHCLKEIAPSKICYMKPVLQNIYKLKSCHMQCMCRPITFTDNRDTWFNQVLPPRYILICTQCDMFLKTYWICCINN
mgnify:CR=1 FL=1